MKGRNWIKNNQQKWNEIIFEVINNPEKDTPPLSTLNNRLHKFIRAAKYSAKLKGVEFNLDADDLEWPTHCPILEIKLDYFASMENRWCSPSIDRRDPNKGYTKDNCSVISFKANNWKSNFSPEEIRRLNEYINGKI